jgi:serine/threonine protein kinase
MIAPASRKIGKYEILRKLGRGGMADVYLAQDTALGFTVALKAIEHSPDRDSQDAIEAERRGAELQAHLAAQDPRVVRVYDSGDKDGYFYLAMEYIEGQDLAELMRRGPLAPGFAVDSAIAVARTLEAAHNLRLASGGKDFCGIVHGDIKPKNIRIDTRGDVRVIDFGIAKALSLSRKLTRNEFGSVPYSSPERLERGEVSVDSDLWALAVMLYEMLTGTQPYRADATEQLERRIRSRVPPMPLPEACPEPLKRILEKALSPSLEARYQTAAEFAEDLEAYRNGRPVLAALDDQNATRRTSPPGDDNGETRRTAPRDEDGETRRTSPLDSAEGETRRTAPVSGPSSETARTQQQPRHVNWPPPRPGQPKAVRNVAKGFMYFAAVMLIWGFVSFLSSTRLYQRGQQLERQIEAEQITDPNDIWAKWTELSRGNSSSLLLHGARQAVKGKMIAAADRTLAAYRNGDAQPVYENNWKSARDLLSRALAVDPDDTIRGKLRLCEGHLARINGTSRKSASDLNLAVEKFNEAQQLLPKSPDPQLGLARVYVYGLKDIDKADAALRQAGKRGFELGNREKGQLADGYRDRGDRLFWDSRNVRGLPQEAEQIKRSRDDYRRALDLYQEIAPWGNANTSIVRVQSSLDSVEFRLQEISSQPVKN